MIILFTWYCLQKHSPVLVQNPHDIVDRLDFERREPRLRHPASCQAATANRRPAAANDRLIGRAQIRLQRALDRHDALRLHRPIRRRERERLIGHHVAQGTVTEIICFNIYLFFFDNQFFLLLLIKEIYLS